MSRDPFNENVPAGVPNERTGLVAMPEARMTYEEAALAIALEDWFAKNGRSEPQAAPSTSSRPHLIGANPR